MELHYVESCESTNDELKIMAEETDKDFYVLSAGEQTKGRGRSGHTWKSPMGTSISTSALLRPNIDVLSASQIPIIVALAVHRAIKKLYDIDNMIKWPNDVLINKRKVSGILVEMKPQDGKVKWLVIGIGVNVHDRDFSEEIKDMATSIDLELGYRASRKKLTHQIWEEFESLYQDFLAEGNLRYVLDEYNSILCNRDSEVKIVAGQNEYVAKCIGIDENGRLIVERDGKMEKIDSGEVHVRGLYGYI